MTQEDLNRQLIAMGMMPLTEISPTPKARKDPDKKTEPKQTRTPTAKAAGVLDSWERAAAAGDPGGARPHGGSGGLFAK